MNKQPRIPDPETSKRLLANLRRSRMEVQEVNLELGEINAMLAEQLREQRLKRVRRSLNNSTAEL
ncbi:hypothetical protein PA905_18750 [Planktothrix agardhii CCAP 1459/11A]|jgi:hypothetical protein|uniref:Uncharacterized protein n=1 Tax=Planktothrix agardhii CCAP 1459/11A TaxID=282420 RepID=A0A479ZTD9_PLAAG|nr:hypothetical protein [Planktothrix agardhii]GCL34896.1 hypothetical protein PA905_18750 [Planktothrix agardhii CCAP 1459/11A]